MNKTYQLITTLRSHKTIDAQLSICFCLQRISNPLSKIVFYDKNVIKNMFIDPVKTFKSSSHENLSKPVAFWLMSRLFSFISFDNKLPYDTS